MFWPILSLVRVGLIEPRFRQTFSDLQHEVCVTQDRDIEHPAEEPLDRVDLDDGEEQIPRDQEPSGNGDVDRALVPEPEHDERRCNDGRKQQKTFSHVTPT